MGGTWSYSTGFNAIRATFHVIFELKHGRVDGRFIPGDYIRIEIEHLPDTDELELHEHP